ncbi:ATP-grasp domain-containing protein [Sesbania bispinosa]|nr:ATP-grasp domain-containing protein [Sesbania bispinosa]
MAPIVEVTNVANQGDDVAGGGQVALVGSVHNENNIDGELKDYQVDHNGPIISQGHGLIPLESTLRALLHQVRGDSFSSKTPIVADPIALESALCAAESEGRECNKPCDVICDRGDGQVHNVNCDGEDQAQNTCNMWHDNLIPKVLIWHEERHMGAHVDADIQCEEEEMVLLQTYTSFVIVAKSKFIQMVTCFKLIQRM